MQYIRVQWIHDHPDEPVCLISELDEQRWEVRKVEVFFDGAKGYASSESEFGGTRLGVLPVPPINQIAEDPQFLPVEITADEFEAIWALRTEAANGETSQRT